MNKFIAVIFPGESQACEGAKAIGDPRNEGNLFVYGMAVAAKEPDGKLSVRDAPEERAGNAPGQ